MSDIESEIQEKGLTAPRVLPADLENEVDDELFLTKIAGVLTICVLKLKNGFLVTGESACASPENFDEEIGKKIARQNAINKLWPLLGFRLKDKLSAEV